jgi:hypothetical protein
MRILVAGAGAIDLVLLSEAVIGADRRVPTFRRFADPPCNLGGNSGAVGAVV